MIRPNRSESGAVAVEAALMMPLITLLFLGIVEFGLLMRDAITTTSASRVGARTASAHSREPTYVDITLARVKESVDILGSTEVRVAIYKVESNGFPGGVTDDGGIWTNCSTNCVQYSIVNGTITRIGGTEWPANASGPGTATTYQGACFDPTQTPIKFPEKVGVAVRTKHRLIAGGLFFFLDNTPGGDGYHYLTTKTAFRLEPKTQGATGTCSGP